MCFYHNVVGCEVEQQDCGKQYKIFRLVSSIVFGCEHEDFWNAILWLTIKVFRHNIKYPGWFPQLFGWTTKSWITRSRFCTSTRRRTPWSERSRKERWPMVIMIMIMIIMIMRSSSKARGGKLPGDTNTMIIITGSDDKLMMMTSLLKVIIINNWWWFIIILSLTFAGDGPTEYCKQA